MSGFKKCGIFPINPGVVPQRQHAPSKAVHCQLPEKTNPESNTSVPLFSPEKEALYQKRYEEQYDLVA